MSLFICIDSKSPTNAKTRLIDFGKTYANSEVLPDVVKEQQNSILKGLENIKNAIIESKNAVLDEKITPISNFDYDKMDKEIEEMEKEAAQNDINVFFNQLYSKANHETKMAMQKSFEESKGTVLSTNWKDVGEKHVDPYKSSDDKLE
ncbi:MAG: hypothetical protein MHPSP_004263 [Paramarteilia canceri]